MTSIERSGALAAPPATKPSRPSAASVTRHGTFAVVGSIGPGEIIILVVVLVPMLLVFCRGPFVLRRRKEQGPT